MRLPYFTGAAEIFAEVVKQHGENDAVVWSNDDYLTYSQLDNYSNRIARALLALGVSKGNTVCICLEKSPVAYGAIFACLKVGAPYFFLDPANPAERARSMINACEPVVAVVDSGVPIDWFRCPILFGSDAGSERLQHLDGTDIQLQ